MKKKVFSLILAFALVFSLSSVAFAASTDEAGDMTMTYGSITFTNVVVDVDGYKSYATHAQVPDGTDLSNMNVTINYNGTALNINGVQVSTSGSFAGAVDFASQVTTIEVVYSGGSRVYYAAAYPTTPFDVTIDVDYSNLVAFSQLTPGAAYQGAGDAPCPYLDTVTAEQIAMASSGVEFISMMDTSPATYSVSGYTTAMSLFSQYDAARGLYAMDADYNPITAETNYVDSIAGIDSTYAGTYTYYGYSGPAGGWMFCVQRGNDEFVCPGISAAAFRLMPGDVVTWAYTCDLGYDIGSPAM